MILLILQAINIWSWNPNGWYAYVIGEINQTVTCALSYRVFRGLLLCERELVTSSGEIRTQDMEIMVIAALKTVEDGNDRVQLTRTILNIPVDLCNSSDDTAQLCQCFQKRQGEHTAWTIKKAPRQEKYVLLLTVCVYEAGSQSQRS